MIPAHAWDSIRCVAAGRPLWTDRRWAILGPEGEGYQLWEVTSEGSPVSPVFTTDEDLARWCEGNATVFGSLRATAGEWLRMFRGEVLVHTDGRPGWHPESEVPL